MGLNEFQLIQKFFAERPQENAGVVVGIGDDAAILQVPNDHELVVSVDTFVAGVHFHEQATPFNIGYKAIAASLSDLAAMGALPKWVTAALTISKADESWFEEFSDGFFTACQKFGVQLVGGDLTHGPLTISVQVHGIVPVGEALLRSTAKSGDKIYVTGPLGNAGLAVQSIRGDVDLSGVIKNQTLERLYRPTPRIDFGIHLRGVANSCIDISDGLVADLEHILRLSSVGAKLDLDTIPIEPLVKEYCSEEVAMQFALSAGDDYELCFTVPEDKIPQFPAEVVCIGEIVDDPGLQYAYRDGRRFELESRGYRHF